MSVDGSTSNFSPGGMLTVSLTPDQSDVVESRALEMLADTIDLQQSLDEAVDCDQALQIAAVGVLRNTNASKVWIATRAVERVDLVPRAMAAQQIEEDLSGASSMA